MRILTEDQCDILLNCNCLLPVDLTSETAKLRSFVYHRDFGIFECGYGSHQLVMAQLHAFWYGYDNYVTMLHQRGLYSTGDLADEFLKSKGTAFRSSISLNVEVYSISNLKDWELAYFGKVREQFS